MKKVSALFNLMIVLSMLMAAVAINPGTVTAQEQTPPGPRAPQEEALLDEVGAYLRRTEASKPIDKIEPSLRAMAEKGGSEEVEVYVSVRTGTDLSKYLDRMITRPQILKGMQNVYGVTTAEKLMAIAQLDGVVAVVNSSNQMREKPYDPEQADKTPVDQAASLARLQELRANEVTYAEAQAKASGLGASGWFDVLDGHKSKAAWTKGFTGDGVIVGVLDDGVDFAHPDLQGTYAWVTDENSPYYGWPMAFSQVSTEYFANEVVFQDLGAHGITEGWAGSRWSDTQTSFFVTTCFECTEAVVSYQPVGAAGAHDYTIPLTSQSFTYKMGTFHELNLLNTYGERVAILVVDEGAPGAYDTVYVDLDNDYDFTDEKPVTQDSPEVYRDMDGDGYADISGGLLAWISDGDNVPPTADWLWGIQCGMEVGSLKACPDSGSLLIFSGPFDAGYTHGTQCASNVAGQGVVNDGLSAPSFREGGMVQGAAPNVGVMDFGNHYYNGTDEDEFIVASLGYDGVPYSGDEVQITSNSYGNFTQMWGSWGYIGRLVTTLNLTIAENTVWVFSGGNEGPGYGPQEGEAGPTIIKAGTSTQFGSTTWDSIVGADQIVYGDPSSFGAKGPNRDGTSGLDILGNGGRGAGDEGLNYFGFNGAESWATWGGTSRSAPVVAGNLALLFEAYKDRYGYWPAWYDVLPILKSSATNSVSSPFLQGGGVVNSDRSTDVAAGVYGVYATPDEWQVGDWEGEQYLNFAKVAWPDSTYEQEYTVVNPSGYEITVDLSDGYMQRIDEFETTFTTSPSAAESGFNFHSPDYLVDMDESDIPTDAELMVVRYVHPYDTFDPNSTFSGTPASSWRMMLYNWTDVNGDGKLWEDRNSNGAVNHVDSSLVDNDGFHKVDYSDLATEIQQGEYIRMDYEFGGLGIPLFVHDPLDRVEDGYFFGFQRRMNDGSVDETKITIRVEFYKRANWPWLTLDTSTLVIPPYSDGSFTATVDIPADAPAGAYEGVIYMNDRGNQFYPAHETALPVVVNVIHDLGYMGDVHFGGGPRTDTLYQNGWTNGYFNWYGGGWTGAGDWRHYFFNVGDKMIAPNYAHIDQNLLIHTFWDDYYPTDINTWVLGPTDDCASNGAGPCAWYAGDIGQPWPEVFGPYTLQPIGSTSPFIAGAAYPFETSTGGPDDWLTVPLDRAGLHEVALHNVLFSGEQVETPFGVDVGTLDLEATIDPDTGRVFKGSVEARVFTETGSLDLWFTPSIDIPNLHATLAGGLETTVSDNYTVTVPNNNGGAGEGYSPWLLDNVWELVQVDVVGTDELMVHAQPGITSDVDLFLVLDVNENGIPENGIDVRVGASGNATGAAEQITVKNPALGQYIVVFNGFNMDPPAGSVVEWYYSITAPGPIPTQTSIIVSDTVTVTQDAPLDPASSAVSYLKTTTERTAGFHASLTGIPDGNDVDLYLMENGQVVASSQNRGNDDELLEYLPDPDTYRFGEGLDFTLYVHGFDVTGEITPTLQFSTDELNLWLAQPSHPDVTVSEIEAGESVSVTLMYQKDGMAVNDLLSARVIAGPEGLPDAISRLANIKMVDEADLPDVQAEISLDAETERGATMYIPEAVIPAYDGDVATYTFTLKNVGTEPGLLNAYIYQRSDRWTFDGWVGDEPEEWYYSESAPYYYLDIYVYLNPGEEVSYQWQAIKTNLPDPSTYADWTLFGSTYYDAYLYYESNYYGLNSTAAYFTNGGWDEDVMDEMAEKSSKEAPEYVEPGETYIYNIQMHNPTALTTPELYLEDLLPEDVEFVNAYAPSGTWSYDLSMHKFTWIGAVPPEGLDIEVEVTAGHYLHDGEFITNEATLSDKFEGDPFAWLWAESEVDDGYFAFVLVDKVVDKLIDNPGNMLHYTVTATNIGNETGNAYVHDALPPYLEMVTGSLSASTGTAVFENGVIHWEGNLGSGASVTITFNVLIDENSTLGFILLNAAIAGVEDGWYEAYSSAVTEINTVNHIYYFPMIGN